MTTIAAVIGVLLGILILLATIAVGFGIVEARRIRRFRTQFEYELEQLRKRIEIESQRYVEAAYYYSEGIKEYKAGNNRRAIEHFKQALKYLSKSARILERIGRAYDNLNENQMAYDFLRRAVEADPDYEPAQRSLALYYRYVEPEQAIRQLKSIIEKNPKAFEAWDFLGLCYRDQLQQGAQLSKDQVIINKAIDAHTESLEIQKRPETEFYLGIMLYFSPTGDKLRASTLLKSASKRVQEQEHEVRIRGVWKKIILAGAAIAENNQAEALKYISSMLEQHSSEHIFLGAQSHLRFLLEGTGHSDWVEGFLDILRRRKEP